MRNMVEIDIDFDYCGEVEMILAHDEYKEHEDVEFYRADLIESENAKLRDTTYAWRTVDRLSRENVKLRKLVDGLTWCCEHYSCRQECPLYDVSEPDPDHCCEVSIKRELGIEVD